jgi:hypothetical protein
LLKIYRTFKQITIDTNSCDGFQEAVFEFDTSAEPYRLQFDEEKLRKTPAFQLIWSLDFPLEKLSARCRSAKFRWISKSE